MKYRRPRPLDRRPTVTVVIPCYNYGHYLPLAARSALEQPGVEVDVIAIDDASTDGSGEVAQRLAMTDTAVRAIVHERNHGHIATYNEGLEQAAGDYVVLLSADDLLPPGSLARAAALLDAEPGVGLVYGFPETFIETPPPVRTRVRSWTVWPGREWIELRCRSSLNCIVNPEVVMRTSVLQSVGGYDPALPHSGDLEMWLRAAAVSDIGRVNGAVQGLYRVHDRSMQRTTFAGHMKDLEGREAAFAALLEGPRGTSVSGADALMSTARRALAVAALRYARVAHEAGRAESEPVDEYLAFAERVWPAARELPQWRRAASQAPTRGTTLTRAIGQRRRLATTDVARRLRWRRWRWSGV